MLPSPLADWIRMKTRHSDPAQLSFWSSERARPVQETTLATPSMTAICLQSGSSGNCTYIETKDAKILVDAGITAIQVERRLRELGRDPHSVDALLVTHDHADHARHMGVYQRKFGIPIHVTSGCLEAASRSMELGAMNDVHTFRPGQCVELGDTRVRSIPTPHDGTQGVAFVVASGGKRLGVLTDLGHVFDELRSVIGSLDAVILESNYDPDMLSRGSYPAFVKQRIRGPRGHLSNEDAAELLRDHASNRLRWACLAHLSEENNDPELALRVHRRIVGRRFALRLAGRHAATEAMMI